MPDQIGIIEGVGAAVGRMFANQNGHSHTGDNNDIYITPTVPPKEGPQMPADDPYLKYRTQQA